MVYPMIIPWSKCFLGIPIVTLWERSELENPWTSTIIYIYKNERTRAIFNGKVLVKKPSQAEIIELDYGKNYRKALYLMVKPMVSCRFSLKPIQWIPGWNLWSSQLKTPSRTWLEPRRTSSWLRVMNRWQLGATPGKPSGAQCASAMVK